MNNELLMVSQVAELLGLTTRRVTQLIEEGHFPNAYKLDRSKATSPYLIPKSDFEAFVKMRGISVS
jgi:excisionase family DNA binding protein